MDKKAEKLKKAAEYKRKYSKSKIQRDPKTEQELTFCREWLHDNDHLRAARVAGYADWYHDGLRLKRKFIGYLSEKSKIKEQEVAKAIVYDQQDLLNQMAAVAFANIKDYIAFNIEEKDGVQVKKYRRKTIDELTRLQASAISNIQFVDGEVIYEIPGFVDKYRFQYSLARNLGLFSEKLIMEHRHAHLHKSLDFKDADGAEMKQLEQLLVSMFGSTASEILGLPAPEKTVEKEP